MKWKRSMSIRNSGVILLVLLLMSSHLYGQYSLRRIDYSSFSLEKKVGSQVVVLDTLYLGVSTLDTSEYRVNNEWIYVVDESAGYMNSSLIISVYPIISDTFSFEEGLGYGIDLNIKKRNRKRTRTRVSDYGLDGYGFWVMINKEKYCIAYADFSNRSFRRLERKIKGIMRKDELGKEYFK